VPEITLFTLGMPTPLTVTVLLPVKLTVETPAVQLFAPPKVQSPPQTWGLAEMRELAAEVIVPPLMVKVPVPSAELLSTVRVPALRVVPPVKVFAAVSKTVPAPFMLTTIDRTPAPPLEFSILPNE
jgi:hypothetical protein